jgi:dTDP-4-amino-4,6-dideoxygalactose transaminase
MATKGERRNRMYVPAWQGLSLGSFAAASRDEAAPFPLREAHRTGFHTARSAIYHLFKKLTAMGRRRVLAPDYHMGNELRAIRAAGALVDLYPVGRDGNPDWEVLSKRTAQGADVLFIIHYAGWPQPVSDLQALCDRHGLLLVEDCALALLSECDGRPLGSFGDYAVFCLYKTLPVLDGGLLVQNRHAYPELTRLPLQRIGRAFEIGQALELWLERFRSRAPRLGALCAAGKRQIGSVLTALNVRRVPVGDIGFNVRDAHIAMSRWSEHLLTRFDYPAIVRRRRHNFMLLTDGLAESGIAPWRELRPGVCPLFFPLLVKDKPAAARLLWRRGVMATELWNEGDPLSAKEEGPSAAFLRRHLLELPIHQDLDDEHIRYMARQVADARVALDRTGRNTGPRASVAGRWVSDSQQPVPS